MAKEGNEVITQIFGIHHRNDGLEPRRGLSSHSAEPRREVRPVDQIQFDDDAECCRSCQIFFSSASTTLSAALYLCDFVSTILVAIQYYDFHRRHTFDDDHNVQPQLPLLALVASVALMAITHIGNLVAFALKLPSEEHIIRSAYFLPLAQLKRLLTGIWRTGKCGRGQKPRESSEVEAVYAILSVAEAGPQFLLQFVVVVQLGGGLQSWQPSAVLVVSVLSSLISAAYNAGRAIMYQSSMRWTFALNGPGIAGGTYTLGALLLRCTTIASVALSVRVSGQSQIKMLGLFMALLVIPVASVNGMISVWPSMTEVGIWAATLEALVAFYLGIFAGPLYPVVHGYRKTRISYRIPLAITTLMNMLVDVIALVVLVMLNWSPCNFPNKTRTIASSEGANLSYLSSTLECPEFLIDVGIGVGLTLISFFFFICSIAGSRYHLQEAEQLIPLQNRARLGGPQLQPN